MKYRDGNAKKYTNKIFQVGIRDNHNCHYTSLRLLIKFRLSLFEVSADQDYIVALDLDHVLDNKAVECIARAKRCITLIEMEITVE